MMTTTFIHTHAYLQRIVFEALELANEAGRDSQNHVPVAGVFAFFATEAWINHAIEQLQKSRTSTVNKAKNPTPSTWTNGDDHIVIPSEFKIKGIQKTRQKLDCLWNTIEWSYRVCNLASPKTPSFEPFEKLREYRDTIGHPRNFHVDTPPTGFPERDEFAERFPSYDFMKEIIQGNDQSLVITYLALNNMPHRKRYSLRFEHPMGVFTQEVR